VLGLANEAIGYVPTRRAYDEGGYEPTSSRLVPGGGELLVEAALELLGQLSRQPAAGSRQPAAGTLGVAPDAGGRAHKVRRRPPHWRTGAARRGGAAPVRHTGARPGVRRGASSR
jgi:hypothetical protein